MCCDSMVMVALIFMARPGGSGWCEPSMPSILNTTSVPVALSRPLTLAAQSGTGGAPTSTGWLHSTPSLAISASETSEKSGFIEVNLVPLLTDIVLCSCLSR